MTSIIGISTQRHWHSLFCLALVFALGSCGKKTTTEINSPPTGEVSRNPLESTLSKQTLDCVAGEACPANISKIVIALGNNLTYCTGFLIADKIVATSATCLPELLRLGGQSCSKDVYFFFPKINSLRSERVGCTKVMMASQIEGQDPNLWRDNVAYLELSRPLPQRQPLKISRGGIPDNSDIFSWAVEQQGETSAVLKKNKCVSVHNSFINPFAENLSSPGMILADCLYGHSMSGAPLLDRVGRVVGVVSTSLTEKIRSYLESTGLLTGPLSAIIHATNFACAPTPFDSRTLDQVECLKELDNSQLDNRRARMLSNDTLFGQMREQFEASLENINPMLKLGVKMNSSGDEQKLEIFPRCFKPLSDWLDDLPGRNTYTSAILVPEKIFKRSMDSKGRIFGEVKDLGTKEYSFQFSIRNLRSWKRSAVSIWSAADLSDMRIFANRSENCQLLF